MNEKITSQSPTSYLVTEPEKLNFYRANICITPSPLLLKNTKAQRRKYFDKVKKQLKHLTYRKDALKVISIAHKNKKSTLYNEVKYNLYHAWLSWEDLRKLSIQALIIYFTEKKYSNLGLLKLKKLFGSLILNSTLGIPMTQRSENHLALNTKVIDRKNKFIL